MMMIMLIRIMIMIMHDYHDDNDNDDGKDNIDNNDDNADDNVWDCYRQYWYYHNQGSKTSTDNIDSGPEKTIQGQF